MTGEQLQARAQWADYRGSIGISLFTERHNGFSYGRSVEFVQSQPGEVVSQPTFALSRTMASQLMDDLWNAGIRPTEQGSPGQIAALQNHLKDMKTIAFHALKIVDSK